jgi:RNA polymerase sigma-70 factor, ECF subfamily
MQTDAELVQDAKRGDLLAFRALYDRHAGKIFGLAYKYHGNTQDAEDSTQDAFMQAYRKLDSFKGEALFSTWLYRITVNICISKKRKRRIQEVSFDPEIHQASRQAHIPDLELAELLHAEILKLKPKQRSVFLLFSSEGIPHAEIAKMLDINENTSKSLHFRAKKQLQKQLLKHGISDERF